MVFWVVLLMVMMYFCSILVFLLLSVCTTKANISHFILKLEPVGPHCSMYSVIVFYVQDSKESNYRVIYFKVRPKTKFVATYSV